LKIAHLKTLMEEGELTPEKLAKRLGISNMTVRRWLKGNGDREIRPLYEKAIYGVVYEMLLEGALPFNSQSVRRVTEESQKLPFKALLKGLGFGAALRDAPGFSPDRLMVGLSQIGAKEEARVEVEKTPQRFRFLGRLGEEWKEKISILKRVVSSPRMSSVDKLAAYGALSYLLSPVDLVPNSLPLFGLMDEYFILGLTADYYRKKFRWLGEK
jgi:uncharacterized membrane protein YkvA (DUF1232 family)